MCLKTEVVYIGISWLRITQIYVNIVAGRADQHYDSFNLQFLNAYPITPRTGYLKSVANSMPSVAVEKHLLEENIRQNFYNVTYKNESSRKLSPDTISKITETLGAINIVGRYLVNFTKGTNVSIDSYLIPNITKIRQDEDLPKAIYTISKNVLGRNVTDSIVPIVKEALPPLITLASGTTVSESVEATKSCTTPDGLYGNCEDLNNCPQLLLNLGELRQSLCFKSLLIPGVCCPQRTTFTQVSGDRLKPTQRPTTTQRTFMVITNNKVLTKPEETTSYTITSESEGDCGQTQIEKFRIVGGEDALPGRWPWMAAIFLNGVRKTEFWCGGALISLKHVLTAAHCTIDSKQKFFNAHQFTVRLGDIDLKKEDEPSSPETHYVKEIRIHPHFNRVGFYNDIAVFVLDYSARRSRYISPLCLPLASMNDKFFGQRPTVVGWGTTYYGGRESTIQRQVELPIWKNEDCDRIYFQPITENFICAGMSEGGKDACQGDSGGPLMLQINGRWTQIGIVSFGNKCGEPGYPGVYTRVTQYLDWIKNNLT